MRKHRLHSPRTRINTVLGCPVSSFALVGGRFKNQLTQIILLSIVYYLLSTFLWGCAKKEVVVKGKEAIPVRAMRVVRKDINTVLEYVGDIKAKDEAVIYPRVGGKVLEKVKEEGSPIKKGEVILYIDRDEVGFKFEKAPVESSLDGIIGRIYVDRGQAVMPQTPVALVVDMESVKIELAIPQKYVPQLLLGQVAEVVTDAYPQEKFIGKVTKISPVLDLETRTTPIEIYLPNPEHKLKSGMFANVSLLLKEHKNVLVVLKEAIIGKDPDAYVYVVKDSVAYERRIKTGVHEGPFVEIAEGLEEGELVVIVGHKRLDNGVAVSVEEETRNQSTDGREREDE